MLLGLRDKPLGTFDLIVDALGANSAVAPYFAQRTVLPYGALWANVPWPEGGPMSPNALEQRYHRASRMAGLLPIGRRTPDGPRLAAFFWSLRRRANEQPDYAGVPVDLAYPFVALTLLSASAANVRSGIFFAGFAAIVAWGLWRVRPPRYSTVLWSAMMATTIAVAWAGQLGLAEGQRALERVASAWFLDYLRRETDPYRSTTALGQVGELKLSSRIVLRVETATAPPTPHRASPSFYPSARARGKKGIQCRSRRGLEPVSPSYPFLHQTG